MKNFLDKIPTLMLIIFAILLGLAPFMQEPHLWQKIKMLGNGNLSKPIDIFDLFLHATPVILLALKFILFLRDKNAKA